jgi:hypothetical protein
MSLIRLSTYPFFNAVIQVVVKTHLIIAILTWVKLTVVICAELRFNKKLKRP